MGNLNVAVLGAKDLAGELGKKGTVTDMTFFEIKRGGDSVTLLEPTKHPERLSSLFYAVGMSEFAILVVEAVDAALGESIVMADVFGIDRGWIVLRNYIQPEQVAPLLAGTCLEGYGIVEEDHTEMRERLLDLAAAVTREAGPGSCGSCPIDSHFNVKGVGTVVLGAVIDGHLRRHDKLTVLPQKREAVLKSIQKHDLDADDCVRGDHVGLALRGIDSDELDRGQVLTTDPSVTMTRGFTGEVGTVRYWTTPLKEGMVVHLGHWMQMVPCRITAVAGDGLGGSEVTFEANTDIIHRPGGRAVIMHLEGGKLRIAGSVRLP